MPERSALRSSSCLFYADKKKTSSVRVLGSNSESSNPGHISLIDSPDKNEGKTRFLNFVQYMKEPADESDLGTCMTRLFESSAV